MRARKKRIYLKKDKSKYCVVWLFSDKEEMLEHYADFSPQDGDTKGVLGAHCAYEKWKTGTKKLSNETGRIYLSVENCGAGVVSHEIMHAILWARGHKKYKKQYPIIIKNMKEEEDLLHDFTYAIIQFYQWFYKIAEVKP